MKFRELFDFKRTKMVDEAAFSHKPQRLGQCIVAFIVVYIIAQLLSGFIQTIPLFIYILNNPAYKLAFDGVVNGTISMDEFSSELIYITSTLPEWITVVSLFATVIVIVVSIYYCKRREGRSISSMGLRKGNAFVEYLIGLLIGAGMIGLTFLLAYITGSVTVSFSKETLSLIIIPYFFAFIIQGASEEILVRGYFMTSIARDDKPMKAVFVSSIAFSLLHIGNYGFGLLAFINIVLVGLFLGIYVFKRGNLWGACAIHTAWNFIQGNIFGSNVSGMELSSILTMTPKNTSSIINGGEFGLEGGICVTVVLIIAIAILLVVKQNPKEITDAQVEYFE